MKCADMMTRDLRTAHTDDSLQAVAWAMLDHHLSFLPVLDDERRFKGALTERALVAHVVAAARISNNLKAGNVAHELPIVGPDDEHGVAEQKMREAKSSRAAVVDSEGEYLGIVTLGQLAEKAGSAEAGELLKSFRRAEG